MRCSNYEWYCREVSQVSQVRKVCCSHSRKPSESHIGWDIILVLKGFSQGFSPRQQMIISLVPWITITIIGSLERIALILHAVSTSSFKMPATEVFHLERGRKEFWELPCLLALFPHRPVLLTRLENCQLSGGLQRQPSAVTTLLLEKAGDVRTFISMWSFQSLKSKLHCCLL